MAHFSEDLPDAAYRLERIRNLMLNDKNIEYDSVNRQLLLHSLLMLSSFVNQWIKDKTTTKSN